MKILIKSKYSDGSPTDYRLKINAGIKKHCMIFDVATPGDVLQFEQSDPKDVFSLHRYGLAEKWKTSTGEPHKENVNLPLIFAVENFEMVFEDLPIQESGLPKCNLQLKIGDFKIDQNLIEFVAMNEGLNNFRDMFIYFNQIRKEKKTDVLTGQIVHWTASTIYDWETADIIDGLKMPQ